MKLERLQFWMDVTAICVTTIGLICNAFARNCGAVFGFGCSVIMSIDILISHRHTIHWWRKYCRAMGWEKEGVDET